MPLSNPKELEDKMNELTKVLVNHDNYAYCAGFNQSLYARIIKAYVPANRHHDVIDLIQMHIDSFKKDDMDNTNVNTD